MSAHSELCWILSCVATMGQLGRMTQYKDKALKEQLAAEKGNKDSSINVGMFTYPVLQAADILLYKVLFLFFLFIILLSSHIAAYLAVLPPPPLVPSHR